MSAHGPPKRNRARPHPRPTSQSWDENSVAAHADARWGRVKARTGFFWESGREFGDAKEGRSERVENLFAQASFFFNVCTAAPSARALQETF
jgi:hypothetical protein